MVFLPSERTGGNIMKKEIETKICSCCGKELKLNKFIKTDDYVRWDSVRNIKQVISLSVKIAGMRKDKTH